MWYGEDGNYYIQFSWLKRYDGSGGISDYYLCQMEDGETIDDYIEGVKRGN